MEMNFLPIILVLLALAISSHATVGPRFCPKLDKTTRIGDTLIATQNENRACDCYKACEDMGAACQMWDFKKQGRICKMYSDIKTLTFNGKHASGVKTDTCPRLDRSDRPDGDMGIEDNFDEPCECYNFCVATNGCLAWAWNKKTMVCTLKNVVNSVVKPDNTYVSGVL
ncbi:uncharacterized protein LOC102805444 [Saccoglossus kowalevskii]|uniref:Uncharacterized protein LOC102805444 n=1 Tax=Saccoglossus kowalevskii TaxID=10224 RepID=A0ABM0MRL4_SACKO|nr:PREDICTED: uncharacterized protein LOC102805444 [Saccoglossus kowalevskii]